VGVLDPAGPLLDSRGRLVGVNTMIYSPSGASSGVGFAIPADTVRKVVDQLVKYGRVVRPGLGVVLLPDQATANVLGPNIGVVIKDVVPGLGAEKAGLRYCLLVLMYTSDHVAVLLAQTVVRTSVQTT
jgi:S1-C subfamily serine protease